MRARKLSVDSRPGDVMVRWLTGGRRPVGAAFPEGPKLLTRMSML